MSKAKLYVKVAQNKAIIEFKDFETTKDAEFIVSDDGKHIVLSGDEYVAHQTLEELKSALCHNDITEIINDQTLKTIIDRFKRILDPTDLVKRPKTITVAKTKGFNIEDINKSKE